MADTPIEVREAFAKRACQGEPVSRLAKESGKAVPTVYVWKKQYKAAIAARLDAAERHANVSSEDLLKSQNISLRIELKHCQGQAKAYKDKLVEYAIKYGDL